MFEKYKSFDEFKSIFALGSPDEIDEFFDNLREIDKEFYDYCPPEYYHVTDGIYQRVKNFWSYLHILLP